MINLTKLYQLALFLLIVFVPLLGFSFNETDVSTIYQKGTPVPQNASVNDWIASMQPSPNCSLPCWWGIQPSSTTLSEAQTILQQKFAGISVTREPFGTNQEQIWAEKFRMSVNNKSVPPLILHLVGNNQEVDYIELALPESLTFGTEPSLAWEYFAIDNLIQVYGTPSTIRLVALHENGSLYAPMIVLYWDSVGMVIGYNYLYEGTWQPNATESVCYDLANLSSVIVRLQSVNSSRSLEELSAGFGSGTAELSTISYLTNQEFAQILIQNNGCLPPSLPADIYATGTPSP